MASASIRAPALWGAVGMAAVMALGGFSAWRKHMHGDYAPAMAEQAVVLQNGQKIYVQKYEVTVAEWMRCHTAGACTLSITLAPEEPAHATPATGLSFRDVGQYLAWINAQTGHAFRLPSKAEWEAMAKDVLPPQPDPLFTDPALRWASSYLMGNTPARALRTTGSFSTSRQGIADLDGSVWEWTSDCFNNSTPDQCAAFYVMGEHVAIIPFMVGDPARGGCAAGAPPAHLGMRLVADMAWPQRSKNQRS